MGLARATIGTEVAITGLAVVSCLAGEYALDAKQSDAIASGSGVCGRVPIRARGLGEPHGGGADRGHNRAGCTRRAHCSEEKDGHADGRATGHPGRPDDRECVLHVFRSRWDGVTVAAGFVFCARGGDRFSARAGDESWAFRLGSERHAADVVGAGAGGVALEQRFVCRDEVLVLLLLGTGVGADTRAGSACGSTGSGCPRSDPRGGARADVDYGGVLPCAGIAGVGGRVEIHCRKCGAGTRSEWCESAGGGVKGPGEVQEVNEVNEAKNGSGGVAAFFDLDGTLVPLPSLEQRLFRMLRYRREIRIKSYFLWLKEAVRLAPRGFNAILQANKMYLRGVEIFDERDERDGKVFSWHKDGHQAKGQASVLRSRKAQRNPRLPVPTFFARAIETVAWHVKKRHEIALLSGTLEPLARRAVLALETELAARGITVTIRVIATRLEEKGGRWTGRVLGEAMFGKAKARAAQRLATELRLDLQRCYAYGDSLNDRWLMEVAGRAAAVNPMNELASIARMRGWPILDWEEKENIKQRCPDRVGTSTSTEVAEKKEHHSTVA